MWCANCRLPVGLLLGFALLPALFGCLRPRTHAGVSQLAYVLLPDAIECHILNGTVHFDTLWPSPPHRDSLIKAMRTGLQGRRYIAYSKASYALYQIVLAPIRPHLLDTVVVVPTLPAFPIPLAALLTGPPPQQAPCVAVCAALCAVAIRL